MIPHTPTERLMLLEEIERGDKVVIPISYEHAEFMLRVASNYIRDYHQATMTALTKDYT
jgi:predicted Mrr-cat superfamily restriction endonuclease